MLASNLESMSILDMGVVRSQGFSGKTLGLPGV